MYRQLWWKSSYEKGRKKANRATRQKGGAAFTLATASHYFCASEVMRVRAKGMFYGKSKR